MESDYRHDLPRHEQVSANDPDLDPESLDFGFDKADFEGLKRAIWSAGQDTEEDVMKGEPVQGTAKTAEKSDEDVQDWWKPFGQMIHVQFEP